MEAAAEKRKKKKKKPYPTTGQFLYSPEFQGPFKEKKKIVEFIVLGISSLIFLPAKGYIKIKHNFFLVISSHWQEYFL